MKLNPDCIRDILYTIEDISMPMKSISEKDLLKAPLTSKYDIDTIFYHVKQLDMSKLIIMCNKGYSFNYHFSIKDLSPEGHKFISNIREDTTWNKTKEIAKKVGSFSIDALKDISTNVMSELIKSKF